MNKKQLVTVWAGAAVIIFFVCCQLYEACRQITVMTNTWDERAPMLRYLLMYGWRIPLIVAVLAVALTCTFKDKKPKG